MDKETRTVKHPSLFLSHSHQDQDWVDRFASALRAANFVVHQASEIPPTQDWQKWLRQTIADSDAVLAVLSAKEQPSPWVLFETSAAEASGKPVIPILRGRGPAHLPLVRHRKALTGSSPEAVARRFAEDFTQADWQTL